MSNLFTDVSSWNSDHTNLFKQLASLGVKAAVVKITEGLADGTNYVNPKVANQITNALNTGMQALTDQINAFMTVVKASGYPKCDLYGLTNPDSIEKN